MVTLILPAMSFAETYTLELNANTTDVEGKAEVKFQGYETDVRFGGGILYSDDEYLLTNVTLSLKDDIFTPALNLGLGFKGIYGRKEYENIDTDYNAMAVGFLLLAEYDFRKDYTQLPVSIGTNFSFSPKPLCFMDCEQYLDFMVAVYFHIVDNAAILAGYRYSEMEIDMDPGKDTSSYDAFYFGCRLSF